MYDNTLKNISHALIQIWLIEIKDLEWNWYNRLWLPNGPTNDSFLYIILLLLSAFDCDNS